MKKYLAVLCAAFACVSIPATAFAFDPPMTDYTWSSGHAPTHMQPASTSFCVLHEIIGKFAATTDYVQIDTAGDGTWEVYGGGNIQNVKATCVNANAAEVQNGVATHWMGANAGFDSQEQNIAGDFCFQMGISGAMTSSNSHVNTYPLPSGQWVQLAEGDTTRVVTEVGCVNMISGDPLILNGQFTSTGGTNDGTLPSYPQNICALTTIQDLWNSTQSFGQIVINPSRGTETMQTSSTFFGDAGIAVMCLLLTPIQ